MTRILVVTNLYPPHAYGGYGSLCRSAVERWRSDGLEVRVLTSDVVRPGFAGTGDDAAVHRWLPLYWSEHRVLRPPLRERLRIERRSRARLRRVLDQASPDVVSVWNLAGLSVGLLRYLHDADIPVVAVVGDRWPAFAPDLDGWARLFDRRERPGAVVGRGISALTGLSTATPVDVPMTLLCASHHLAADTVERGRFRRAAIDVVPHGVDLDSFPVTSRSSDHEWSGRLVVVSRLDPRKGVATTIRALARLPEMTLDIVGSGDLEHLEELRGVAADAGVRDRVTFHGEADRSAVRAHYLTADVAIVPSEWAEPFGIVPLEAMACGTPVVATGTGGSGEFLVDGRNCLRFTPADPASLAGAVERLRDDRALRAILSEAGNATAASFSQAKTFDALAARHVDAATLHP